MMWTGKTMPVSLFILIATLCSSASAVLDIVPQPEILKGATFYVKCSADAIELPQNINSVLEVILYGPEHSDGKENELATLSLKSYNLKNIKWKKQSLDRNFEFTFPTTSEMESLKSNFSKSRELLKIDMRVKKAACKQSGTYSCLVKYLEGDGSEGSDKKQESINITVGVSEFNLGINRRHTLPRPDNEVNTTISLLCTAVGPGEWDFYWKYQCPTKTGSTETKSIFVDWPVFSDIQLHPHKKELTLDVDTGRPNDCLEYKHEQSLAFTLDRLEGCEVMCLLGPSDSPLNRVRKLAVKFEASQPLGGGGGGSKGGSGGGNNNTRGGTNSSSPTGSDVKRVTGLVLALLAVSGILKTITLH